MSSMRACAALGLAAFFLSGLMQIAHGEATVPARKIDGKAIDQGIAYVLMLLAL
ncbi:unnamed protein product, partial [Musa textilis]